MSQQGGASTGKAISVGDLDWSVPTAASGESGFDEALHDLGAAERRVEAERRMRHRAACEFLAMFYRSDVENAKVLKQLGIATGLAPTQIAFAKAGRPAEVAIVVTGGGGLSVMFAPGGLRTHVQKTDLGDFDPLAKSALRRRMIGLVIGYLGVGDP